MAKFAEFTFHVLESTDLCWRRQELEAQDPVDASWMLSLILDGLLESLARLESRNLAGLYLHPLSGLRVFTFPRLLLPDVELPEAGQLDLLARLERLCYGSRESLQVFSGFALWRVGVLDHPLYELLFVHGCSTACLVMLTSLSPTLGRSAQTCEASWLFCGTLAL